jgi:hypothetical protein
VVLSADPATGVGSADVPSANGAPARLGSVRIARIPPGALSARQQMRMTTSFIIRCLHLADSVKDCGFAGVPVKTPLLWFQQIVVWITFRVDESGKSDVGQGLCLGALMPLDLPV